MAKQTDLNNLMFISAMNDDAFADVMKAIREGGMRPNKTTDELRTMYAGVCAGTAGL
jgi:hypothetical protein